MRLALISLLMIPLTLGCGGGEEKNDKTDLGWLVVSAGSQHSCGVATSESIECWGKDDDGQSTPPSGSFKSVSTGRDHSCGVTTSGSIECWGYDGDGRATPPEL